MSAKLFCAIISVLSVSYADKVTRQDGSNDAILADVISVLKTQTTQLEKIIEILEKRNIETPEKCQNGDNNTHDTVKDSKIEDFGTISTNDMEKILNLSISESLIQLLATLSKINISSDDSSSTIVQASQKSANFDCKELSVSDFTYYLPHYPRSEKPLHHVKQSSNSGRSQFKMHFAIKAAESAYIKLSPKQRTDNNDVFFEIEIKPKFVALLRLKDQVAIENNTTAAPYIDERSFKKFYIEIYGNKRNCLLTLRTEDGKRILKYKNPSLKTVKYFNFSSRNATVLYDCPPF